MSALRTALGVSIVVALGSGASPSAVEAPRAPRLVTEGPAAALAAAAALPSSSSGGTSSSGATSSSGGSSSGSGSSGGSSAPDDDSGLPTVGADGGIVLPSDDAGPAPVGDGGGRMTPPPATDGGADQTVCGTMTCDSKTDMCCLATRMCVATGATTCRGSTLACSGSNSCAAGDVCCQEVAGRATTTSKCMAKCPAGDPQLCTTNADCTGGDVCRVAGADYGVCGRPVATPPGRDGGIGIVGRDGGPITPGH